MPSILKIEITYCSALDVITIPDSITSLGIISEETATVFTGYRSDALQSDSFFCSPFSIEAEVCYS